MRQGVGNAISIMGSRPTSNNFMIDGTANIDTALGTPAAILSVDAIQEFKEQTTTYSAEYGFSANQINLVSKSGTNKFHGTVFGFMRNEALDARNFFDPPTADKPQARPEAVRAASSAGPCGRNKTFFLVQLRRHADQARLQLVLHRAEPGQSRRAASRRRSSTRSPGSRSRTTPFRSRASRGSRSWRCATAGIRRRTHHAAGQLPGWSARCRRIRTSTPIRSTSTSAGLARCSAASRRRPIEPHQTRNLSRLGTRFVRTRRTGRCPHTWPIEVNLVNQFRVGCVEARADQDGIHGPQADVDSPADRRFHDLPDIQREYPARRHRRATPAPAAPSTTTRPATSRCGT